MNMTYDGLQLESDKEANQINVMNPMVLPVASNEQFLEYC
jgi:hypothetical protein